MADNIAAALATLATDDIGGVHYPRTKMVFGADGAATDVSAAAPLPVVASVIDAVSAANSSAVVLAGAAAFTGTAVDTLGYSAIAVGVYASHASGTDGLSLQQSSNGTNWDSTDVYTVPATTGKVYIINPTLRYFRVVYTNGATLQTEFRLQTVLRVQPFSRGSVQRPQDARTNDNDFDETLAYMMMFNGTTHDRVRGDTTNGVDVDVTRSAGQAAHSAAVALAPVRTAGKVITAVDTTLVANDTCDTIVTNGGAAVVHPFAVPDVSWTYAAAASGIVNTTTAVTIKAAAAAGIRNYISSLQLSSDTLGGATEVAIRDGAGGAVLWRGKLQTTAMGLLTVNFSSPIRGTAATLLEVVTLTAVTGGVYVNAQGFTAP